MKQLIAKQRIEAAPPVSYDPGAVLPADFDKKTMEMLVSIGAAEWSETADEVPGSDSKEPVPPEFLSLVETGVLSDEQLGSILKFWEITTWGGFLELSEAELIQVKGVGKATAQKIKEACKKVQG